MSHSNLTANLQARFPLEATPFAVIDVRDVEQTRHCARLLQTFVALIDGDDAFLALHFDPDRHGRISFSHDRFVRYVRGLGVDLRTTELGTTDSQNSLSLSDIEKVLGIARLHANISTSVAHCNLFRIFILRADRDEPTIGEFFHDFILYNVHRLLEAGSPGYLEAIYAALYWNNLNEFNKSLGVISAAAFAKTQISQEALHLSLQEAYRVIRLFLPGAAVDKQLLRLASSPRDRANSASSGFSDHSAVSQHQERQRELALKAESSCEALEEDVLSHVGRVSFMLAQRITKWLGQPSFTCSAYLSPVDSALKHVIDCAMSGRIESGALLKLVNSERRLHQLPFFDAQSWYIMDLAQRIHWLFRAAVGQSDADRDQLGKTYTILLALGDQIETETIKLLQQQAYNDDPHGPGAEYLHNAASQAADHESARLMTHAASIWRDLRPSARLHFTFEAYQVLHPATGHHHRPSATSFSLNKTLISQRKSRLYSVTDNRLRNRWGVQQDGH